MVHALKTLRPYLLDKPFELHTDNVSLQWLQQQCHVSHHVLVSWAGHDASGDTWEQLRGSHRRLQADHQPLTAPPGRRAPPLPTDAAAPPPIPPAGFTVDLAPPGDLRAALVGRAILYWWPEDGWQRGTVAHLCLRGQRGTFLHVVAYMRETSALRGTADALLVAASCFRWVLLSPVPGAGVVRPPDSAASVRSSGRSHQP